MKEITLCNRPHGCCPVVKVGNEGTIISNDEGETLVMSNEEFEELKKNIIAGEFD